MIGKIPTNDMLSNIDGGEMKSKMTENINILLNVVGKRHG